MMDFLSLGYASILKEEQSLLVGIGLGDLTTAASSSASFENDRLKGKSRLKAPVDIPAPPAPYPIVFEEMVWLDPCLAPPVLPPLTGNSSSSSSSSSSSTEATTSVSILQASRSTSTFYTAVVDEDRISRQLLVRDLVHRAVRAPLSHMLQETLLSALGADPACLLTSDFNPSALPTLIEHNPNVAIECLQHIRALTSRPTIINYLSALARMDASLHSMEVVNRLSTSWPDLPPEFVHLYVANCISSCDAIKDKYVQNRLVRLLCVFLQSLIRSGTVSISEVFVEVQAFCVQFSRIKEAASLFRLLKNLDGGGGGGGGSGGMTAPPSP